MKIIAFGITPVAKPRMVRSDSWKQRPCVVKYWQFKQELNYMAQDKGYKLGDTLDIVFRIPMPKSWSKKKKKEMFGKPHKQKPDWDNLAKAFMDCLLDDDSAVYKAKVAKYWADVGRIEVLR